MLNFSNVIKKYDDQCIVDIPQLEIKQGLYWLKGANGSGKSTLLKMTGGQIPFEGEINIDGVEIKRQPAAYRRLVSYAEAEPLYPDFISGNDLIKFYNSIRKADAKTTDGLSEQLGVVDYQKKPIGTYSSGMIKKLSLVLAFIGQSKFIFLDEPFVTLDQRSVQILYGMVQTFHQQGTNFIFTSHQEMDHDHWQASELLMNHHTVCLP